MAARTPSPAEEAALSLTMAVVSSSLCPLVLLDGNLCVVGASDSFFATFGLDPAAAPGRPFVALGAGEWDASKLQSLLASTLSGAAEIDAYEMNLTRDGQETLCVVIHAEKLDYLDHEEERLLLAVSDVTAARADARQRDEAEQQNLVLLREVRHRVANSLQIIASVLLQNARKSASEETRGHLRDAHNRVMSVAALERQLSESGPGPVELQPYLTSLCHSIAASMIADPDRLSLSATGGEGTVDSKMSVSLGLIVTELVINALKHAFPEGRAGRIVVDWDLRGPNWSLSVADDGVGMPSDPSHIHTGLGTSIVQALAKQLQATVTIERAEPGTRVAITRIQVRLADRLPEADQAPASKQERPGTPRQATNG